MGMSKGLAGNKIRTIVCDGCGKTITRRMRPGQRFCSTACSGSAPKPERRTGERRSCERCGTAFYVNRARIEVGQGRFCTIKCHNANQGRNKTVHTCKTCHGEFRWSPSRSKSGAYTITYCSPKCRDADPERREMLLRMNAEQQRVTITKTEAAGYAVLDSLGVEYERQALFAGKFTPDALIPSHRLVVQFDGDYWHDRKGTSTELRLLRRVALDLSQDAYATACGWRVVRLWESDLRRDPSGCAERIRQHLCLPSPTLQARTPAAHR